MGLFREYLSGLGFETEMSEMSESFKSTAIPTKILGFKEDYLINHITKDSIEIFDKNGEFETLTRKDSLFKELEKIIQNSETTKYYDYKKEFPHNKYYIKNDWDSDFVVTKLVGELPINKIKRLF